MKSFLVFVLSIFLFGCRSDSSKSLGYFTEEENQSFEKNKELFNEVIGRFHCYSEWDQKRVFIAALSAVQKDTTTYRTTEIVWKDIRWLCSQPRDRVFDSLLRNKYGAGFINVDHREFVKIFNLDKIDTLLTNVKCNLDYSDFHLMMYEIERIKGFKKPFHDSASKDCQRIFINDFKNKVVTGSYKQEYLSMGLDYKECLEYKCAKLGFENIKVLDPIRIGWHELLIRYCVRENKGIYLVNFDSLNAMSKRLNYVVDTTGIFPIVLEFDSLGTLKSVNSKKQNANKEIFDVYQGLSGMQTIRLLDERRIGFIWIIPPSKVKRQ